ncbi:Uncharacterised protein [Shigella sonnei]|nr:Uncharacterised protein [Shigella sonnei]
MPKLVTWMNNQRVGELTNVEVAWTVKPRIR